MRCDLSRALAVLSAIVSLSFAACNGIRTEASGAVRPPPSATAPVAAHERVADPWIHEPPARESAPPVPSAAPAPPWARPCTQAELRDDSTRAGCAVRDEEYFRRVAALDPAIDVGAPSDFNPAQSFDPDADETATTPHGGMNLTCEQELMTARPSLDRASVPLFVGSMVGEELLAGLGAALSPARGFAACRGGKPGYSPFAEHVPACGDALVKNFALFYRRLPSSARDPGCRPASLLEPAFRYANDPACAPPASWKQHGGIALDRVCAPVGIYLLLRAITPYASRASTTTFAQNIEYIAQTLGIAQRMTAKSTLATPTCKLVPVKPIFMPKW